MAPELVIELMAERSRSQSKSPVQGPYRFHPSRGGRIEENASSRIANPESHFNSGVIDAAVLTEEEQTLLRAELTRCFLRLPAMAAQLVARASATATVH